MSKKSIPGQSYGGSKKGVAKSANMPKLRTIIVSDKLFTPICHFLWLSLFSLPACTFFGHFLSTRQFCLALKMAKKSTPGPCYRNLKEKLGYRSDRDKPRNLDFGLGTLD